LLMPFGGLASLPSAILPLWVWLGLALVALGTAFLPTPLAPLAWAWLAFFLPCQPIPPDKPGPRLTWEAPQATLPEGVDGALYSLELSLAHGGGLPAGTPVAILQVGQEKLLLRAGREAAEWACLRADVQRQGGHGLPQEPVFRPSLQAPWAVAGRLRVFVPAGVAPLLTRDSALPRQVTVTVEQAGPEVPPPKRTLSAESLLLASTLAATLSLPGFMAHPWAAAPFAFLAAARLFLAFPLQPLRILLERHGVDLALAAYLLAWALAWRQQFHRRRWALPALALLLPLALAAPGLSQLMGDEPYHLALAESLARDGDLDVSNNVDSQRYPLWVVQLVGEAKGRFLHSPALALLLFPGYLLAGRRGMVLGVSLLAWLSLVALEKRARQLGFSPLARFWGLALGLLTYPLALFATEIWPEIPAAAAVSWQLVWSAGGAFWPAAAVAVLAILVKARLGLVTVPLVGATLWTRLASRRGQWQALLVAAGVGALALGIAAFWFGNPLDPLGRRALSHLLPGDWRQPLRVVGGLLLDGAYGIGFSAPLWLVALGGLPLLWRRGSWGERALILGGAGTLAALLSYVEWRGGGSPPFRYLVPLLPLFCLGLLASWQRSWGRAFTLLALPPSLLVGWVSLTRPALLYNIGDGGMWLADRLAMRFAADARHFFPSYLRPSLACFLAPLVVIVLFAGGGYLLSRQPPFRRWVLRQNVGLWLCAACALVVALRSWPDRVVELEDPQVDHMGGILQPHPGAWSRFLYANGWRLGDGQGLTVPLHLRGKGQLVLVGWVEGAPGESCQLSYAFTPQGPKGEFSAPAGARGEVALPSPGPGRVRLAITTRCGGGATLVLDRLEVRP